MPAGARFGSLVLALVSLPWAPAAWGALCNCPAAPATCTITASCTVPAGTYQLPGQTLVVHATLTFSGTAPTVLEAGDIVVKVDSDRTGRIFAGGDLTLRSSGNVDVQRLGSSPGIVSTTAGGALTVDAVGSVAMNGRILASKTSTGATGGTVSITAQTGDVVVSNVGITSQGSASGGTVSLLAARNLAVGGKIEVTGLAPDSVGGSINLTANTGSVSVTAPLDVRGGDAGIIDIDASTVATIAGQLLAVGQADAGYGGSVEVTATTGNVAVSGGIDARGGGTGAGGDIFFWSELANVIVDGELLAAQGDCDSTCAVQIWSGGTATTNALVNLNASNAGNGGDLEIIADRGITINGPVTAAGAGEAGTGGSVDLTAAIDGDITVDGVIDLQGAGSLGTGGDGGTLDVTGSAGVAFRKNMNLDGHGSGSSGGSLFVLTNGLVSVAADATLSLAGQIGGGLVDVVSTGGIEVAGKLTASGEQIGGSISLAGCDVAVTAPAGSLVATPDGSAVLRAGGAFTIAGAINTGASGTNELRYRLTPPVVTGPVTPPAVPIADATIPCCGVCPTSTTTTSTTTTTTTTSSSTTTTAPTIPATTSTTTTTTLADSTTTTGMPTTTTTTASTTTTIGDPTTTTTSDTTSTTTSTTTTVPVTTTTTTAAETTTTTSTTTTTITTTSTTTTTTTSTTSTSTTTSPTTTTTTSSTSTLAPSTTTSVAPTTTTVTVPTTTTLPPPVSCEDEPLVGYEAVGCRLDLLEDSVGSHAPIDLGGKRSARRFVSQIGRAGKAVTAAKAGRRVGQNLRRAAQVLRAFQRGVDAAIRRGMTEDLAARLRGLAGDATAELGVIAAAQH